MKRLGCVWGWSAAAVGGRNDVAASFSVLFCTGYIMLYAVFTIAKPFRGDLDNDSDDILESRKPMVLQKGDAPDCSGAPLKREDG